MAHGMHFKPRGIEITVSSRSVYVDHLNTQKYKTLFSGTYLLRDTRKKSFSYISATGSCI